MTAASPQVEKPAAVTFDEVTVAEAMHPGVLVCGPESPLRYAARVMATHGVHAVVVLGDEEEGGLWGIVSDGGPRDGDRPSRPRPPHGWRDGSHAARHNRTRAEPGACGPAHERARRDA